ncbi:hypothetical protein MLD38_015888 [Melastoma candidum]|uniref:Uncharacterized protein n=1 Tax=Melastoma candidum TaxID=119954 RepID=A0ACB9RGW4_9MYRT|nr:hypothetical protein MLD38_015888 [Melastoma candidum]
MSSLEKQFEEFRSQLEFFRECPGQYNRYHGDWRSETRNVEFLVTFMHWLETGDLILHDEAANLLGLNSPEFGLDLEDYLIGLRVFSFELGMAVSPDPTMLLLWFLVQDKPTPSPLMDAIVCLQV